MYYFRKNMYMTPNKICSENMADRANFKPKLNITCTGPGHVLNTITVVIKPVARTTFVTQEIWT